MVKMTFEPTWPRTVEYKLLFEIFSGSTNLWRLLRGYEAAIVPFWSIKWLLSGLEDQIWAKLPSFFPLSRQFRP